MIGTGFAASPWREIVEKAQWAIAIGSADGHTLDYVNPAFAAMHGWEQDELTGKPIASVLSPAARLHLPEMIAEIYRQGNCHVESEHVRKDGQVFSVLIDATAVCDANGKVAYHIVNVQDITQQTAVQEELRIRKEFFGRMFTDAPVAMAIADLSGRYIYANPAMCRMLGYSEAELLQMTYRDVSYPDDVAENDKRRDDLINGHIESFEMEKRYVRKDGRAVWVLMVVSIIKGPDGKALVTLGQMLDIDRLKRTEAELRESEARLKEAQHMARIGSWKLDFASGNLVWSNEVFRLFEIDPTQFPATYAAFLDAIHPEDRDAVDQAYKRSLETREPYQITHHLRMNDGRIKWVIEKCRTDFDAAGKPLRSVGTVQDITELKAAELALSRSNETYQSILSTTLDGFWIVDPQGRFLDVNNRYCEQSGYTREELLGMRILDVEANEKPEETAAHIRHVIATGSDRFETRHRRKDGSLWDVEVSTASDLSGDGTLYVFLRDITQRKQAEVALHESYDLLHTIIDTAPIRVFWKDRESRYLGGNMAFARDAGKVGPHELIGKTDDRMVWAAQADLYRSDDRQVMESGVPKLFYEEPQTTPDGSTIWLSTSKTPLRNRNNDIIGVLGIYQDITDSKNAEQALLASRQQLRELAAHHEQMLEDERKHIAHEIHDELGQQLSALKLDVGLLRRNHGDDPKITELAHRMRQNIDRSFDVVRQVASHLRPAALDLGVVAAIEWLAGEFSSRYGIDCEVDATGDERGVDDATAIAVFRIVQESLTNIARHAAARRVSIVLQAEAGQLHVSVHDDGRGFDPEQLAGRTGYGLFGMRERVLSLDGVIVFKSRPGCGTSVLVTLPLKTP